VATVMAYDTDRPGDDFRGAGKGSLAARWSPPRRLRPPGGARRGQRGTARLLLLTGTDAAESPGRLARCPLVQAGRAGRRR